jgi:hypothetical protein
MRKAILDALQRKRAQKAQTIATQDLGASSTPLPS